MRCYFALPVILMLSCQMGTPEQALDAQEPCDIEKGLEIGSLEGVQLRAPDGSEITLKWEVELGPGDSEIEQCERDNPYDPAEDPAKEEMCWKARLAFVNISAKVHACGAEIGDVLSGAELVLAPSDCSKGPEEVVSAQLVDSNSKPYIDPETGENAVLKFCVAEMHNKKIIITSIHQ